MKKRNQQSTLNGQQTASRRRGSILILVIALLVMLALIGTAFITTTRLDRTAAAQESGNAQVDIEADAAQGVAINAIVNDLFATTGYRQPGVYPTVAGNGTNNFTAPQTSTFLASRIPIVNGAPTWEWITGPLAGGAFEDPTLPSGSNQWGKTPGERQNVRMGFQANTNYPTIAASTGTWVAADADGDGIADSGLVRLGTLPSQKFSGVTFYFGARIIDGNSAVNATTAWSYGPDADLTGATAIQNTCLTPASIGLQEMVASFGDPFNYSASTFGYNNFRFGDSPSGTTNGLTDNPVNPLRSYMDYQPSVGTYPTRSPINRGQPAQPTADYAFMSQMDWLWTQLGTRVDFPGYSNIAFGTVPLPFQAPSLSDTATLAHRFCLATPAASSSFTDRSILEQKLPKALVDGTGVSGTAPTVPYANATTWFTDNFNFTTAGGYVPKSLRSLVVTRNAVSNLAPVHKVTVGATFALGQMKQLPYNPQILVKYDTTGGTSYKIGDVVSFVDTATPANNTIARAYVSVQNNNNSAPTTVARWIKAQRNFVGFWNSTTNYLAGDIVIYPDSTSLSSTTTTYDSVSYECVTTNLGTAPVVISGSTPTRPLVVNPSWRVVSWAQSAARTDVNKATFDDLWPAYWNVMVNDPANNILSPFTGATTDNDGDYTYEGNQFVASADGLATGTSDSPNSASLFPNRAALPAASGWHPQRMFRSPIREFNLARAARRYMTPGQVIQLRSAIAAVNLLAFRDSASTTIPAQEILIPTDTGSQQIRAVVFGMKPQPVISEVFVQSDTTTPDPNNASATPPAINANGYVAIELHNPTGAPITMTNWVIGLLNRDPAAAGVMPLTYAASVPIPTIVIPANNFVVLENFNNGAGGTDAAYRPGSALVAGATGNFYYVAGLATAGGNGVFDHEMVILRPRDTAAGAASNRTLIGGGSISDGAGTGAPVLSEFVPVDSFDFTGVQRIPTEAHVWHYVRPSLIGANAGWHDVYPGRYDGDLVERRQQGTQRSVAWDPTANTGNHTDPWDPTLPGGASPTPAPNFGVGSADGTQTYPDLFAIHLNDSVFANANPLPAAGAIAKAPFGGFMRNGDLLRVPFIGSYILYYGPDAAPSFAEVNSVTMDATLAEDTDQIDNAEENIGRFCPIITPNSINAAAGHVIDESGATVIDMRYGWASRLFDYLTVQSPQTLRFPNVSPDAFGTPTPQPVSRTSDEFKSFPEEPGLNDAAGIEGMVNPNTAPLPVLEAVPWVTCDTNAIPTPAMISENNQIAAAIVAGRAAGPYRSLFDLNRAVNASGSFRTRLAATSAVGTNWAPPSGTKTNPGDAPTNAVGTPVAPTFTTSAFKDYTQLSFLPPPATFPPPAATLPLAENTINDFTSQYLMMSRLSNLITTRSDTFTVYIVVEGWTNVGSTNPASPPTRVTQHRLAFLVDRTGVTSSNNRVVKITPVPTD